MTMLISNSAVKRPTLIEVRLKVLLVSDQQLLAGLCFFQSSWGRCLLGFDGAHVMLSDGHLQVL